MPAGPDPFTFTDGERTIHFGRGRADAAVDLVGGPGFALLSTDRALAAVPALAEAAAAVHRVGRGGVDVLAGELLGAVAQERVVALGGGRVIDTGKSVVAARGGVLAAVPTTLSGAEMTATHRPAPGAGSGAAAPLRPAVVVFDPAIAASQPEPELAASSLNALGHAVEAPCTVHASPVPTLAAHEAARLIAAGWSGAEPDRDVLALGALLAGYAIGGAGYGLHHVLSQTLVRVAGVGHGHANAVMLPHTTAALRERLPAPIARLEAAIGRDPAAVAAAICARTGAARLRDLGVAREALAVAADAAAQRPELDRTPPRAARAEVLALYEGAW